MNDLYYIKKAYEQAKIAYSKNEVPIGAILVIDNKIISRAYNLVKCKNNVLYHAELLALTKAFKKLDSYRLHSATLYITVEPCLMCLGAILNAKIKRIVFGVLEPKTGSIVSNKFNTNKSNIEYDFGFLENDIKQLLQDFFIPKR